MTTGLALAGCGGASSPEKGSAASLGRPLTAASIKHFRLDGVPIFVAVGAAGKLWLGGDSRPVLYEVDPETGRVVRTVNMDRTDTATLRGIAPLGRELWVGSWNGPGLSTVPAVRTVSLVDGAARPWITIRTNHDFGLDSGFAINADAVFMAGYNDITRFPVNGGEPRFVSLPDPNDTFRITAIAATRRVVWCAVQHVNRADGRVVYSESQLDGYDADTLKAISRRSLGQDVTVTSLLARGRQLWAATEQGPVLRIDPNGATHSVSFPRTTQSLLADRAGVWVIEIKEGLVDHISDGGAIDETIRFEQPDNSHAWDDTPQTLAALPGQLWVGDYESGSLWRITLTHRR